MTLGQIGPARTAYADALRLCQEQRLDKEALWVYHNLGLLEWHEGNRENAFAEWERELNARVGGLRVELAQTECFLAEKYELFDRQRANELYGRAVAQLEGDSTPGGNRLRAEAAYCLAVLLLEDNKWDDVVRYTGIASACFSKLVQHEHRLAWCQQLKALAYDALENKASATDSRAEAERLLALWGEDYDRFRALLARASKPTEKDENDAPLREAEHAAITLGPEARIDWYIVAATRCVANRETDAALEYIAEALVLERDVEEWRDRQGPVLLHRVAAELLVMSAQRAGALAHAQIAFNLDASNYGITLLLAITQFNAGRLSDLDETIETLDRLGATRGARWRGTRRLLQVGAAVKRDNPRLAARLCSEACRETKNEAWAAMRDEFSDIDKAIRTFDESLLWRSVWQVGQQQRNDQDAETIKMHAIAPHTLLTGIDFYDNVLIKTANWLLDNQGSELTFIQDYRNKTNSLLERHFRDAYRSAISMNYRSVLTEENRTRGPSDLTIPSGDGLRRKVRFEFKVWGREHTGTVTQLLSYMSDEEDIGVVYMVNPTKKDIADSYRQQLMLTQVDYKTGSLRERPVLPEATGFKHFRSTHRMASGRCITVYHFIHNFSG